jgi:hypothetical protein
MNREYANHIQCSATWRRSSKLAEQSSEAGNKNSWRYERGPSWKVGDSKKMSPTGWNLIEIA